MTLVLSWHNSEAQTSLDFTHEDGNMRIVLSAARVLRQTLDDAQAIVLSRARCEGIA